MTSFKQFLREGWKPKIGKIYSGTDASTGKAAFDGTEFAILGFRGNQAKVRFMDSIGDVDNFDLTGKWAVNVDRKSEKEPTKKQKVAIDKAIAFIHTLDAQ